MEKKNKTKQRKERGKKRKNGSAENGGKGNGGGAGGGEERRERGFPLGQQQLVTIWRCIVIGQQFIWE